MLRSAARSVGITGATTLLLVCFLWVVEVRFPTTFTSLDATLAKVSWLPSATLGVLGLVALPFHLLRLSWILALAALASSLLDVAGVARLPPVSSASLALALGLGLGLAIPARARVDVRWLLAPSVLLLAAVGLRTAPSERGFDLLLRPLQFPLPFGRSVQQEPAAALETLTSVLTTPWFYLACWSVAAGLWLHQLRRRASRPTCWFGIGIVATLLLPSTPSLLPAVSLSVLGIVALLETLHGLAFEDELTGVASRRALDDALGTLPSRYVIALVDIDHFKKINDRYGHEAGDQVLRAVAAKLRATSSGEVFRYGGEEFALLFRRRSLEQAEEDLERARRSVAARSFTVRKKPQRRDPTGRLRRRSKSAAGRAIKVRVSAGIADAAVGDTGDVLRAADQALYRAKRAGRNRVMTSSKRTRARSTPHEKN